MKSKIPFLPQRLNVYIQNLLKSDINKRIATGAFWSLSGTLLSKGLLLLSSVIIARMLGAEQYGEIGIIRSTVDMFSAFAAMGISLTAAKYISEYRKTRSREISNIIQLSNFVAFFSGLIFAILILLFSDVIALQIKAPHLVNEIRLSALMIFLNAVNSAQNGILVGFEDFKSIARANLWSGVISFFLQIIAAYLWGVMGAIVGFCSNFIILWVVCRFSIKKHKAELESFGPKEKVSVLSNISILWKFSIPSVLAGIMLGPVAWVCNMMLVRQENGYVEMALFDVANQWRIMIGYIPGILSQMTLPMLSSLIQDKSSYLEVFNKNLKLNLIISTAVFIIVLLFSVLITRMYGDMSDGLWLPLIIMGSTALFGALCTVTGQAIASLNKMWLGLIFNLFWAILLIAGGYILIDYYKMGAVGLAISYFIAYMFYSLIQYAIVKIFFIRKLV